MLRYRLQGWLMSFVMRLPRSIVDSTLLAFPSIYKRIYYESYCIDAFDVLGRCLEATRNVEGDIGECGSARCGTSAAMGIYLRDNGIGKRVYAFDSYGAGFDPDELPKERSSGLTKAGKKAFTHSSYEYVVKKMRALGLESTVVPVRGFFKDTLPTFDHSLAAVLIDCDLGESAKYCLESLWPRLSAGGMILIDDYYSKYFQGVKPVTDDFVQKHSSEIAKASPERFFVIVKKRE